MLEITIRTENWYREKDPEGSLRYIRGCGFEAVDYYPSCFSVMDEIAAGKTTRFFEQSAEELREYYRPVKAAAERNHIKFLQWHAPFPIYVEGREDLSAYQLMTIDKLCALCEYMECPALVVHPFVHADKTVEREINLEYFGRMIPGAKKHGVKLCIENLYRLEQEHLVEAACSDAGEACWYIDTLNAEAGEEVFGFCFDTGHANVLGRNIREFLKGLGKRLTTLHIHDNGGVWDQHMIPFTQGAGSVNWDSFLDGLREIDYKGPLSFETTPGVERMPEELKTDALRLISSIGRYFRTQIEGKRGNAG